MKIYLLLLLWFVLNLLLGCQSRQQKAKTQDLTPKTHVVEIKQMKFVPEQITVQPGDSIKWINRDIVSHNVAEEENEKWKSPNLEPGATFSIKVSETASYLCTLHPVMKGNISINDD